jgi:alpha-tubulin suppressor-like RCC1 family protein
VQVLGIGGGSTIVAGGNHTCVLTGGDVWCWGQNSQGQIGDGTTTDRNKPVKVLSNAVDITAGLDYTCAVMSYGQVMCWGNNDRGQLANGKKIDSTVPTTASLITGISSVDAGQNKSCGITSAGLLRCLNGGVSQDLGQVPAGTSQMPKTGLDVAVNRFGPIVIALNADGTPVIFQAGKSQVISSVDQAKDADSGVGHMCVLLSNGTVKCWGANEYGQLGINSQTSSTDPKLVVNVSAAWQLAVGKNHACVLITSKTPGKNDIQCWGLNTDGQLGNGSYENSLVPVFVK